jgi:hypothetical protein
VESLKQQSAFDASPMLFSSGKENNDGFNHWQHFSVLSASIESRSIQKDRGSRFVSSALQKRTARLLKLPRNLV